MTIKLAPLSTSDWPNDIQDPVYFINDQWAVTEYGLERMTEGNPYEWEANRLLHTHENRAGYKPGSAVLSHIGPKTWVDAGLLIEAFRVAIQVHCADEPLPFDLEEEEAFLWINKREAS